MGGVVRKIFSPRPVMVGAGLNYAAKKAEAAPAQETMPPEVAPATEVPPAAATEEETLMKKKAKGRYGTVLTGGDQSRLGNPEIGRKTLLGG